jgi:serpin B
MLCAAVLLPALPSCATDPAGPPAPLTALPRELTTAELRVAGASNAFAFDLLRRTAADRGANSFVSPLSVSMALGMLMNGADGATLDAMRVGLRHATPNTPAPTTAEMNAAYRGLIDLLRGLDPTSTMRVANGIWYREGFAAAPSFLAATRSAFDAAIREVDFADGRTLAEINGWVKEQTAGKIPTILEEIAPDDVMYLINAIYFKGAWKDAFDPRRTSPGEFRGAAGTQTVPMMTREVRQPVLYTDRYAVTELPYGNGAFTMTIVLPNAGQDVHALVEEFTADRWATMIGELTATAATVTTDLTVPKFTLELTRELNDDLAALGMGDLFDPTRADLTKLATGPEQLYVGFVRHKTFVDVNEVGTEAAAVTAIGIRVTSAPVGPPPFRVDRPFLFAIRERFTGTILFLGKIVSIPS